ncbi:MAG: SwmB domain-containing protein [Chloroflexi bacterium]|nr:SwmB domain-containing protein [Chloroflexota bacterium]
MRHQTASLSDTASRSARIVVATAAFAAAVALLALLPAFGQSTFDHTDGRTGSGNGLSVGVFADIEDAQLQKNDETTYQEADGTSTTVYVPNANPGTYLGTQGFHRKMTDTAYLADGRVSPQNTYFNNTLYVSNDPEAYNTLLITVESTSIADPGGDCAIAEVRNGRTGDPISVQVPLTTITGPPDEMQSYYQAFVRVLDSRAEDDQGEALYADNHGPACDDDPNDPDDVSYDITGGIGQDDTASILARHNDIITVSMEGAGTVSVRVDGEGPDLLDVTPEDLGYYRSRDLEFAFTVRDDDAGLRHDGELVVTEDGDYTQANRDEDHTTSGEPLSMPSAGQISVNGNAADIDVMVWGKDDHVNTAEDVTHTGRWTLVGSRPGVAYAFSARGDSMDEGPYYMEVTARDRAGNATVTYVLDERDEQKPYLFTVDDTEPTATQAWTGIAYDLEFMKGGREIADRSWIMVDFGEPLRRNITPDLIKVAGHEVVSVVHPPEAPLPERRVLGRDGTAPPAPQRLSYGPPAPRAAPQLAPQLAPQAQDTCTVPASGTRITSLSFRYNETTGAASISWDRLNDHDCNGYRLAILVKNAVLVVEDLQRFDPTDSTSSTWTYSIPRASELGRYIEAQIRDTDEDEMRVLVALRYASAGSHTDNFGSAQRTATYNLDARTAPSTSLGLDAELVKPYLLHPPSVPVVLPEVLRPDASLECEIHNGNNDEVLFSAVHRPTPDNVPSGWERVGYYWQLFYPPDFQVTLDRAFKYTALGADGHETSVSYQGFFEWTTRKDFNAQGEIAAVYEDSSGRRLAGAVRTLWCSASTVSNPTVDRIPPHLVSTSFDGTMLKLTYSELLNTGSVPHLKAYNVSGRSVTDVGVSGRIVTLTLSSAIGVDEGVTLSYEPPPYGPVEDLAGNDASRIRYWRVQTGVGGGDGGDGGENWDFHNRTHEEWLAALGYWPIDINGELIEDVRSRIYVELARELKADETPELLLFGGGVYDLAGNPNETENVRTRDGIAPRLTITVTAVNPSEVPASAGTTGRPVANHRGEFIVDVRSDEELRRRPESYFTSIDWAQAVGNGGPTGDFLYQIGSVERGGTLTTQEDAQHWRGTYSVSGLSGLEELFGLVVYGYDAEGNIGESGGWTPDRHQRHSTIPTTPAALGAPVAHPLMEAQKQFVLDLPKMHDAGALLEVDREFNGGIEPEVSMTPHQFGEPHETESVYPYVHLNFSGEAMEYAVCPTDGCGDGNPDPEFFDSHPGVTITEIMLDDGSMMTRLAEVGPMEFAFQTLELDLGRHEVAYTAVDDAGNEFSDTYTFRVVERTPYELELTPGWNLISVPGTPAEPSLDAVIPPESRVSPVLSYQDGDWVTAALNDDGEWRGNLTRIEAGPGYWVFATTFQKLSTLIPEAEPASVPPAVRVNYGWNLVGVIDLFQNPAGAPPGAYGGGSGEADEYFKSVPWRIAYTYNTLQSLWVRTIEGADTDAPEGTTADEDGYREVVTREAVTDADGNVTTPEETKVVTVEIVTGKGYWVWASEPGTLVP